MTKKRVPPGESPDDSRSLSAAPLVAVPAGEMPVSEGQRTFNQLSGKILRRRKTLAAWDAFLPRFQQRVASELAPVEREARAMQRRLVERFDALLSADSRGERLTRKQRESVRNQVLSIITDILEDGPDPDLEALFKRHNETPAEQNTEKLELAESFIARFFGADIVNGHTAHDPDELFRHAEAKLAERAEAERRRREGRKARRAGNENGPTKADLAAARKAEAEREANRPIREIYRRLASALHPDRESRPAERERKTLLMQRVNQAYERGDLLALLALQIEVEQIDSHHLTTLPEERLRDYNAILRRELRNLEEKLQVLVRPFRFEMEMMLGAVTPQRVERALDERIAESRRFIKRLEEDLRALAEPRSRRRLLDELPHFDDDDDDDMAIFSALFAEERSPPRAKPSGRGRKRRSR